MLQFTAHDNLQTKADAPLLYLVLICTFGKLHQSNICCVALLRFPLNCGLISQCSRWSSIQWYKMLEEVEGDFSPHFNILNKTI